MARWEPKTRAGKIGLAGGILAAIVANVLMGGFAHSVRGRAGLNCTSMAIGVVAGLVAWMIAAYFNDSSPGE